MKARLLALVALLGGIVSGLSAAPPTVPALLTAEAGQVTEIVVKHPKDKKLGYRVTGGKAAFRELKGDFEDERVFWLVPDKKQPLSIVWWTEGETTSSLTEINKDVAPPSPSPGPDPTPTPTPAPVGFRVIFVYETSDPLTPLMQQVMFGEKVRNYLDAKTVKNGTQFGWRRFDKDVDVKNEKDADIKALWTSARPQVTTIPCVIVAVGGKADILPFPSGEDDALTLFKKYGGN